MASADGDSHVLAQVVGETYEAEQELWDIIIGGSIRTFLQPVVDLKEGKILGYEALSRGPAGSPLETPDHLFHVGRQSNLLFSLERVCRRKALLAKSRFFGSRQSLFLNVDPQVVHEARHQADITKEVVTTLGIDPGEVVLELTERTVISDYVAFARALEHYTQHGFKVAVDDVGAGYSNLRLIAEVKPHFIKIDMSLVRGIDSDPTKQALMETLASLAAKVNARVVAEGVETAAELTTLASLGVTLAQGYFLARPSESPPSLNPEALQVLRAFNRTLMGP